MVEIVSNVLGVFALKDDVIIEKILFSEDPKEIAGKLGGEGEAGKEEVELVKKLIKTGTKRISVADPVRFHGKNLDAVFEKFEKQKSPFFFAEQMGLPKDRVTELLAAVNTEITRTKLATEEEDRLVIQAVSSLTDLEEAENKLTECLREWYSIHYPELDHAVAKNQVYAKIVSQLGDRKNLEKTDVPSEIKERLPKDTEQSLGAKVSYEDLKPIQELADSITELAEAREKIEAYIEQKMQEVAPNMTAIAGANLSARLIAHAGSLKRLSELPAGTIQILGAENAFFRFMKTGKRPPKHGLIFAHPQIRSAPKKIRGKLARTLAAKIALASKMDRFGGEFMGEKLKKDFEKRVGLLTKNLK